MRAAQQQLVATLEELDGGGRCQPHHWQRPGGGGGTAMVLQAGEVIERAGVNVSAVYGEATPPSLAARHPAASGKPFFATGLSMIVHPVNPYVPSFHANYRYFEVGEGEVWWFGGGADLTPHYPCEEDARHFHSVLKALCDRRDAGCYARFKRQCDDYFYLPHRGEMRGIGGIFFDELTAPPSQVPAQRYGQADFEADLAFVSAGLEAIAAAYFPIVQRRSETRYGAREREWQLQRRGRYVEFNLVYDRGTLFGLQTKGNIEAILVSLPPLAAWSWAEAPEPGSPEERLGDFLKPRDWIGSGSEP